MYDLLICNARVIDGTGNPSFHADVAVKNGKIVCIAQNIRSEALRTIDGTAQVLAPGFIDAHSHQDLVIDQEKSCWNELEQGATTLITGMCGKSHVPMTEKQPVECSRDCSRIETTNVNRHALLRSWYMHDQRPIGANMGALVGHGALRTYVMGYENRKPTEIELGQMKELAIEAMCLGALGISLGLSLFPGCFADTEELVTLCKVAANRGGLVCIHLRNEGEKLVEATKEALDLVRESGVRCVISHHKAIGGSLNWNKTAATLSMIEKLIADGYDVFCDQYPYAASATGICTNIPQRFLDMGDAKVMEFIADPAWRAAVREEICRGKTSHKRLVYTMIGDSTSHPEYAGRMLNDLADENGVDPYDFMMDLLEQDHLSTAGIFHTMSEEDVERIMRWNRTMIGSDGICIPNEIGNHPRTFATFPRVLGRYVRERKVITLEDAVRKMSYLPAMVFGLGTKGLIREGMDADLVLFDPVCVRDCATYAEPWRKSEGISYVIVDGQIAVENGDYTGILAGKMILKRPECADA